MAAVGELLLVLGLLVSAHCEVRSRDPGVEEEEELGGGVGERGNLPPRNGNWCAFVQKRVATTMVACGIEKYTIKSQSPCPSRIPDCQVVMYKLSTRPLYKQQQKIVTALQWLCCPGHVGHDCEDTVPDPLDSGGSGPTGESEAERAELRALDMQLQLQLGDPNREQNDHQAPPPKLYDASNANNRRNSMHTTPEPGHAHKPHHTSQHDANTHDHRHEQHEQHEHQEHQEHREHQEHQHVSDVPAVLPAPHMMALVMLHLQPVLQGFNRSLEHLSRQVGELAQDVAQLKSSHQGAKLQAGVLEEPEHDEAVDERLEAKLEEVFEHIRDVRAQMDDQRMDLQNRLHSQHAMLHYNLTSFKTDIDMKLKRHQKMLQVSLQAMNTTLSEMVDQDQITETPLDDRLPRPSLPPHQLPQQPSDSSSLWDAIERLDKMVVNNTVKVSGLMEDVDVTSGSVQQLRWDFTELEKLINQTARNTQILFMETGLEVLAAEVRVLRQVEELASNVAQHSKQLQELDSDVDYLYKGLYKNHSAAVCNCKELTAAVAQLERSVSNVTALANKNKMALDEDNAKKVEPWGGASDWELAVEAIQHGLQQVKESLVSEQNRTRTLDHTLTRLSSSLTDIQAEVGGLQEEDTRLRETMEHLSGSFKSLLNDAIRHNDVLELLLGEEVLEFLEWPYQDQEANSIPAMRKELRHLQEQLSVHNLSIRSPLESRTGGGEEVPPADQPSSSHLPPDHWLPGDMRRSDAGEASRERQLLLHPDGRRPELGGDGSDLWNLEKTVEELGLKVQQLEEKPCPCPTAPTQREVQPRGEDTKLQAEVTWLKRGLEEHLRVFKNVFINADVLVGSEETLDLDKLSQLVKNQDGKKEKRKKGGGRKEGSGRGGDHRHKRDSSGVPVLFDQSEDTLMFVAGSPLSLSESVITFNASLNRGQFHSDTGTFTAPVGGLYLFILTLDLRPGPAHVVLQRASGGAPASLHRWMVAEAGPATGVSLLLLREGEEVRLELRGGAWAESEDNVFTGLLLQKTT